MGPPDARRAYTSTGTFRTKRGWTVPKRTMGQSRYRVVRACIGDGTNKKEIYGSLDWAVNIKISIITTKRFRQIVRVPSNSLCVHNLCISVCKNKIVFRILIT